MTVLQVLEKLQNKFKGIVISFSGIASATSYHYQLFNKSGKMIGYLIYNRRSKEITTYLENKGNVLPSGKRLQKLKTQKLS